MLPKLSAVDPAAARFETWITAHVAASSAAGKPWVLEEFMQARRARAGSVVQGQGAVSSTVLHDTAS